RGAQEGSRVEPAAEGPIGTRQHGVLAGGEVGAYFLGIDVQRVAILVDEDRRAGTERGDAAELPPFQQGAREAVQIRPERNVPYKRRHEPVPHIVSRRPVLALETSWILAPRARGVQPALLVVP